MRGERLIIPPALLQSVYAHAAAAYPRECCGLIFGPRHGARLDEVRRCGAAAAGGDAARAFRLELDDLRALAVSLDGPRPARVLYHSHPDAPPCLSAADTRGALLGGDEPAWPLCHLVVEVRAGAVRGAALHAWDDAAGRFREVRRFPAADGGARTGAPAAAAL